MIHYKKLLKYFIIFIGVLMIIVLVIRQFAAGHVKDTEPYKVAVEYATSNNDIKLKTGGVLGIGKSIAYDIRETTAYLTFTVLGETDDVTVYCDLSRSGNRWQVDKMEY